MPEDKRKNPSPPGFFERLRGKRTKDIYLPNDTGERDRRLPKPTEWENARRGLEFARSKLRELDRR